MTYQIGRDGQQLGAFTQEEVVLALANGSLYPTDLGWTEGMANWQPLSTLLPVAPNLPMPPVVPVVLSPAYHPLYGGPMPQVSDGFAITSLVLGLASLVMGCLTALPAIIFGHLALGRIKRSNGTRGGRGMAMTGLIIGYVLVGIIVAFCLFALIIGLAGSASH